MVFSAIESTECSLQPGVLLLRRGIRRDRRKRIHKGAWEGVHVGHKDGEVGVEGRVSERRAIEWAEVEKWTRAYATSEFA